MNISFWSVRSILILVVVILALTRLSSISNTIFFGLLCSVKLITASEPILFTARVSLLTASMACTNLYLSHPDLGNISPWNFLVAFLWPCANMMLFGSLSVASPGWLFFCPVTRQQQPLKLLSFSSPMFGHTLASHATSFLIMIIDSSAPFGVLFCLCLVVSFDFYRSPSLMDKPKWLTEPWFMLCTYILWQIVNGTPISMSSHIATIVPPILPPVSLLLKSALVTSRWPLLSCPLLLLLLVQHSSSVNNNRHNLFYIHWLRNKLKFQKPLRPPKSVLRNIMIVIAHLCTSSQPGDCVWLLLDKQRFKG